ncbi:PstS family phosphate ABC transporter substrate-binding protein [Kamptonema sp. UHCC 0994]|uniref:PstS family phosphate ABC transporter substrate-binding protein n=1 Tax=Kamptonema sp. UHCC 0994 TaxID=3031329 RepID=UPI0023B89C53|nr:PstS family phosphate ABC transporter substrate-binding protein [Kamptonema sp. UHCC 0994]MDF0554706.1 PstS family phosphate ABC transporter substrate-binding protein [Kamptonema sp. UHCC 0994]
MKATKQVDPHTLSIKLLALSATTLLNSCTQVQSQTSQPIKIDGSSTVYPITDAIAKDFQKTQGTKVPITVEFSGTGGGFRKFCAGEIDISNASRPIRSEEMEACNKAGIRYYELPIAFDALTVVVNSQNSWAKDITVAELKKLWEPAAQGKITKWNQIRSSWPNQPINLYGAGQDSGTFDYFTEAAVGKAKASRTDYTASEDDNVLVQGVIKDPNALGYFGLSYYEANQTQLKALEIDSGKGPVMPRRETVEKAQYQPLTRPLFIYINYTAAQNKPEVRDFVQFYMEKAPKSVNSVGYIPLPKEGYQLIYNNFYNGKVGTVFGGEARFDLTIGELLRKEKKF